ncbi:hypothetical protein ACP4OV_015064 [Aristida adscensionis]
MRKSAGIIALDEVPDDLADCDGSCAPGGGLCCPADSLDAVLRSFAAADDGFLEALGISAPTFTPPPPPAAAAAAPRDGEGAGAGGVDADGDAWMLLDGSAPGCGGGGGQGEPGVGGGLPCAVSEADEAAFDVDMFFAGNTPDGAGCGGGAQTNAFHDGTSCHAAVTPAPSPAPGPADARGAAGDVGASDGTLLTHDTLPAWALMTTSSPMLAAAPGGGLLPLPATDAPAPPAKPLTTAAAILPPRGPDARGAPEASAPTTASCLCCPRTTRCRPGH